MEEKKEQLRREK